jgi:hypothetical protein
MTILRVPFAPRKRRGHASPIAGSRDLIPGTITGLYFAMPPAWQRQRRQQMLLTLPPKFVDEILLQPSEVTEMSTTEKYSIEGGYNPELFDELRLVHRAAKTRSTEITADDKAVTEQLQEIRSFAINAARLLCCFEPDDELGLDLDTLRSLADQLIANYDRALKEDHAHYTALDLEVNNSLACVCNRMLSMQRQLRRRRH